MHDRNLRLVTQKTFAISLEHPRIGNWELDYRTPAMWSHPRLPSFFRLTVVTAGSARQQPDRTKHLSSHRQKQALCLGPAKYGTTDPTFTGTDSNDLLGNFQARYTGLQLSLGLYMLGSHSAIRQQPLQRTNTSRDAERLGEDRQGSWREGYVQAVGC
jgi:hypothetical protein